MKTRYHVDKIKEVLDDIYKVLPALALVFSILAIVFISLFHIASEERNVYLQALSVIITLLMVIFVARQTEISAKSLEEMRKQRLINVVIQGIGILNRIKQKIETNFDYVTTGEFEKLEEIGEELEKPEFVVIDDLLGMDLFQKLDYYNFYIKKLKETDKSFREFLCRDNTQVKELVNTVVEAIKNDPELKPILNDPMTRAEANVWPCELVHRLLRISWYYKEPGIMIDRTLEWNIEKLYSTLHKILEDVYTYDKELINQITIFVTNIEYEAREIMFSIDKEDQKAGINRDKRIKLIDEAIQRLKEEYIMA